MMKLKYSLIALIFCAAGCSPKLAPDNSWGNRRWVLTEMKGVPVQLSGGNRDAFIEFSPLDHRFVGNGGCNRISGNYSLARRDIHFTEVISTKMSCPDISFETTFLELLNDVDGYEVEDSRMVLKDGRKTVLTLQRR